MLDVFVTVDTEVWTDGWDLSPGRLREYYDRYIEGRTPSGDFGLTHQLQAARERDLKFVFFVEPLFAYEFGVEPLRDIIDTVRGFGQEVALHLHAEWSQRATRPILERNPGLCLRDYPVDDQARLVEVALELFEACGVKSVAAFRAGSFGANEDTPKALARHGIAIDSSHNPAAGDKRMFPRDLYAPQALTGTTVREYPLTAYEDYPGHLRWAQLASSSVSELTLTMGRAAEIGRRSYVLLSHSFELLNSTRTRADRIVVRRFDRLCDFLADHRDEVRTRWFSDVVDDELTEIGPDVPLPSSLPATLGRFAEQAYSRAFAR